MRWTDFLRQSGYRPNAVLGSGMEGTVIDLGDNLVAKIWHRRTASELQALQTFYEAVAHADASFDTPRIRQVLCLKGQFATVETLLSGRPLRVSTDSGSPDIGDDDVACVTDVLAALAAIEATADMGVLPILEDDAPFETEAMPFARSLAALVERRVEKFREPLLARLPELDVVVFGALAVTVSPGQEFQKGLGGQRRNGDRDVAWEFDPHS